MKQLHTITFIREHSDWQELLTQPPYCLKIKYGEGELEGLVLLEYSQFESDFSNPIVKECRGLILDSYADWQVVSYGFNKFLNAGEPGADEIDWSTARTQAKLDGSNVKIGFWHRGGRWLISTLAVIDAEKSKVASFGDSPLDTPPKGCSTYGGAARTLLAPIVGANFEKLSKYHTYIFELLSRWNKVVIDYGDFKLYHIGTRDNLTLEEINVDIGVPKPREYPLHTLDAVLGAAQQLNKNSDTITEEGYVVVDANWHRIKVKSPLYLLQFHATTSSFSLNRAINIYLEGEQDEMIAYFPKSKETFDAIDELVNGVCAWLEESWGRVEAYAAREHLDDKAFALFVKQFGAPRSSFFFAKRKCPKLSAHQFLFGGSYPATEADGWTRQAPLVGLRKLLKKYWPIQNDIENWSD